MAVEVIVLWGLNVSLWKETGFHVLTCAQSYIPKGLLAQSLLL